ncbi:MAG: MFS transporter [Lactobacillales bacterium]|nr:MFS transporter [Lactobacillales bacterium]
MKLLSKYNLKEKSWIFYDWANSAYSLVVVTAILPIYFKYVAGSAGISGADSTAYWGYASSFASIIISLTAPILGTLGDYQGYKKKFFDFFAFAGILLTLSLALVPNKSWVALLIIFMLSYVSFQGANVFYDGFLVDVTEDERMDDVSAAGYGLGYFGSSFLFILVMILQVTNGFGKLDTSTVTKISFVLTALWWFLFSIPFFKNVKQVYSVEHVKSPVKESFLRIAHTIKEIRKYKNIVFFLVAYFFYIDGVDTIFTMASSIGVDFGIDTNKLIIMLLLINFIAFPFTILYGKLATKFGTKRMILVAILTYAFISLFAIFIQTITQFWILAVLVGMSQGGIQALSRSYFAQMVPKENANEFFGFYNIFGKFSAIMGPLIVGFVGQLTGKSQYGMGALVVLFLFGGFLFWIQKEEVK